MFKKTYVLVLTILALFLVLLVIPTRANELPIVEASGLITSAANWTSSNVYVVKGDLHVTENATLTISPGTVVKIKGGVRILIDGMLNAQGTAENIIYFTDFRDDTVGGDTNGDGDLTSPAPAGWAYMLFGYNVDATAVLDYCVFRYGSGSWGGWTTHSMLTVDRASNVTITNSELSQSSKSSILINNPNACVSLSSNHIYNNGRYGVWSKNSNPSITGNTISNNAEYGMFVEGAVLPIAVSGNTFSENILGSVNLGIGASGTSIAADNIGIEGLWITNGIVSTDATWSAPFTYVLNTELHLYQSATLTISSGTVVKIKGGVRILIDGTLNAQGTAENKIYFTDFRDDTVGGDTNGDGDLTSPAPAGWTYMLFGYTADATAVLDYCVFRYGSGSWGGWTTHSMLTVDRASNVTITNSELSQSSKSSILINNPNACVSLSSNHIYNNGRYGVWSKNSNPSITGNTISNNAEYGMFVEGAVLPIAVSGNTFSENILGSVNLGIGASGTSIDADNIGIEGLWITNGTVNTDTTWSAPFPYVLTGHVNVEGTSVLTISPGVIIKTASARQINVINSASIIAEGSAANPIRFTTLHDDGEDVGGDTNGNANATLPSDQKWIGIRISDNSSGSFAHCVFRYGGESYGWGSNSSHNSTLFFSSTGNLTVSNSDISYSRVHGVRIDGANGSHNISISDCYIHHNTNNGIWINNSSVRIDITNSTIQNNTSGQVYVNTSPNVSFVGTPVDTLTSMASQGVTASTTKITATPGSGNRLVIYVSQNYIGAPDIHSAPPTGNGVIDPYTNGNEISGVNSRTHKYVGVYAVDSNNRVKFFSLHVLTRNEISPIHNLAYELYLTAQLDEEEKKVTVTPEIERLAPEDTEGVMSVALYEEDNGVLRLLNLFMRSDLTNLDPFDLTFANHDVSPDKLVIKGVIWNCFNVISPVSPTEIVLFMGY